MKRKAPWYSDLADRAAAGTFSPADGLKVLRSPERDLFPMLCEADKLRRRYFGNRISTCSILNVKSGRCGEDCAFCAQAGRFKTGAPVYGLVDPADMDEAVRKAKSWGTRLGFVTSGKSVLTGPDFEKVLSAIRRLGKRVPLDASFGLLGLKEARLLKAAGVRVYHHNIETAPSFFRKICSTHTFEDRLETLRNARKAGLKICCGGILGLGETLRQRVEFAFILKTIAPHTIPLNFLNPVAGTPLGRSRPMDPLEALRCVALFRFANPRTDLKICGGRPVVFRGLQPLLFLAGASGLMIGDYLTTAGRKVEDDLALIRDLGLLPVCEAARC